MIYQLKVYKTFILTHRHYKLLFLNMNTIHFLIESGKLYKISSKHQPVLVINDDFFFFFASKAAKILFFNESIQKLQLSKVIFSSRCFANNNRS